MNRCLAAVLLITTSEVLPAPISYFVDCDDALNTRPFSSLRKYLDAASPVQQFGQCMRLSNTEFVVTGNRTGPFNGEPSNFFYCNLGTAPQSCIEDQQSSYYPNLGFIQQFSGPNRKQFVLWKTSSLSHGVEASGYGIFALAPKSRWPRGYEAYALDIGTHCSYSEGNDCPCDNLVAGTVESVEVNDPEVIDAGKASVTLVFKTSRTDCTRSTIKATTVSYVLKDGHFVSQKYPAEP